MLSFEASPLWQTNHPQAIGQRSSDLYAKWRCSIRISCQKTRCSFPTSQVFFPIRLLSLSACTNLKYGQNQNTASIFREHQLRLIFWSSICRTKSLRLINAPHLANSLTPLAHRCLFGDLRIFYRYFRSLRATRTTSNIPRSAVQIQRSGLDQCSRSVIP